MASQRAARGNRDMVGWETFGVVSEVPDGL